MWIFKVGALAVGMTFAWAMLVALVYHFPIPLQGYESGLGGLIAAPVAVLFYGVLWGGLLVPIALALIYGIMTVGGLGALGERARLWISANVGAFVSVIALATPDYVIGHL